MKSQLEFEFPNDPDEFLNAIDNLPPLPRKIQYEDDYDEEIRSIDVQTSDSSAVIWVSGGSVTLMFSDFHIRVQKLVKSFLLSALIEYAPGTISSYYKNLKSLPKGLIEEVARSNVRDLQTRWSALTTELRSDVKTTIKRFLSYLCDCGFLTWNYSHQDLLSHLPAATRDPYSVVRAGDCFLEIEEEAKIVRWLDQASLSAARMDTQSLQAASLVLCSYQFGMRPVQLGIVRKRDCTVRYSGEDGSPTAYLTFRLVKQRNIMVSRLPLLRKVKHEWAPLLANLEVAIKNESPDSFLFGFKSRATLSAALIEKLEEILPGQGRIAYDLRHSMAQRMVDAGSSQEELASALGHTHLRTGLVYFRASANQAELVNKALGLSETYTSVAKIANMRFISPEDLASLKGEQQIAGVPHGLPISGIGGCTTGQPSCPFNPITACYGCPKFMPVKDVALHEQVLRDFQSVVTLYVGAGAGEVESPAYLQLRRTISEVQTVITQIEVGHA